MLLSSAEEKLLAQYRGGVLCLTINRPLAANAIDSDVARALVGRLATAGRDNSIQAVILTGAGGRVFSSGRDMKRPATVDANAFEHQRRSELVAYSQALLSFHKPFVVALNGVALGAGLMLALHADHVVAAQHVTLTLPEIDLEFATYVGHALVADSVGSAVADQLALTGRCMGAAEALACRLVHAIVPASALAQEAEAAASLYASKPVAAFRAMKAWILDRRQRAFYGAYEWAQREAAKSEGPH